jgi:hypothetical protein
MVTHSAEVESAPIETSALVKSSHTSSKYETVSLPSSHWKTGPHAPSSSPLPRLRAMKKMKLGLWCEARSGMLPRDAVKS